MGNRANVYVHDGDAVGVYLYTHWGADELAATVRSALAREQRWNDDAYLARIIFNTMTRGKEDGETGFGISAYEIGANFTIDVDTSRQTVKVSDEPPRSFRAFISGTADIGADGAA